MRHESSDPSFNMSSFWSSSITKPGYGHSRNHNKRTKFSESKESEAMFLLSNSSDDDYDRDEDDYDVHFDASSSGHNSRYELKTRNNLHNRNSPEKRKIYSDRDPSNDRYELIEKQLEDGDTLQSLSLKYGVTIYQLKRANGMMSDQDFYGLTSIKIPVKKFGIHTSQHQHSKSAEDLLTGDDNPVPQLNHMSHHNSSQTSTRSSSSVSQGSSPYNRSSSLNKSTAGHRLSLSNGNNGDDDDNRPDVKQYIKSLDEDLKQMKDATQKFLVSSDIQDVPVTITTAGGGLPHFINGYYMPHVNRSNNHKQHMDGADCGLSIWQVLILVIIVCILIPVIYIFMVEEKQIELHNQTIIHHDNPAAHHLINQSSLSIGSSPAHHILTRDDPILVPSVPPDLHISSSGGTG